MTDHRKENNYIPSFLLALYQQLYSHLARGLHVNDIILDYNYQRLLTCIDIMTNERIQYRFSTHPIAHCERLPLHEYTVALEFYLQFDGK